MNIALLSLLLVVIQAGATVPTAAPSPTTISCAGLLADHEAWVAARFAEIPSLRARLDKFRADDSQGHESDLVSSSAETDVEAVSLEFFNRTNAVTDLASRGGGPVPGTLRDGVRIIIKSRASLEAATWFLTTAGQTKLLEYMTELRALQLELTIQAPHGRHTTLFSVGTEKAKGLHRLLPSPLRTKTPLVIMDEMRVPPGTSAARLETYLIDGKSHFDNNWFGQSKLRVAAIREQMKLDLEALDTPFEDAAGAAAKALLAVAAYEFDPFGTDSVYFKPNPHQARHEGDELFFKQALGALRLMQDHSFVYVHPWRLRGQTFTGPTPPAGWFPRAELELWPTPTLKSGFLDAHNVMVDGVERAAILSLAIEAARQLGYEWVDCWVKQARLR